MVFSPTHPHRPMVPAETDSTFNQFDDAMQRIAVRCGDDLMAIPYSCPSCGQQGKVADKLAGQRVKCKNCGATMRIPDAGDAMPMPADPYYGGDPSGADPIPLDPLPLAPTDSPGYEAAPYAEATPVYDATPIYDAAPVEAVPLDAGYAPADPYSGYAEAVPADAGYAPIEPIQPVDTASDFAPAGGIAADSPPLPPIVPVAMADGTLQTPLGSPAGASKKGADSLDADSLSGDDDSLDADDLEADEAADDEAPAPTPEPGSAVGSPATINFDPNVEPDEEDESAPLGAPAVPGLKIAGVAVGGPAVPGLKSAAGSSSAEASDKLPPEKGGPGAASLPVPPVLQEGQRFCPKCGGVISSKTHLCRHCGFDLNFEHLLTGEKINVDLGRPMPFTTPAAPAAASGPTTPRHPISWPRVVGAVALIASFFLPWLTGVHDPREEAPRFKTPTTLSGLELFTMLQSTPPALLPKPQAPDESEPITRVPVVADRVPPVLRAGTTPDPNTRLISILAVLLAPVMGFVVLVWELGKRNTSIILCALPAGGLAMFFGTMGVGIAAIGFGFWVAAGGALLSFIATKAPKPVIQPPASRMPFIVVPPMPSAPSAPAPSGRLPLPVVAPPPTTSNAPAAAPAAPGRLPLPVPPGTIAPPTAGTPPPPAANAPPAGPPRIKPPIG